MTTLKYINSNNVEVDFRSENLRATSGSFHTREWDISGTYKMQSVERSVLKYEFTCQILGKPYSILNNLNDVFEYDLEMEQMGKLYFNDYYLDCYIQSSAPSVGKGGITNLKLGVFCFKNEWKKQTVNNYKMASAETVGGFDFPFDFPFDFGSDYSAMTVLNDSYKASDFKIVFYGSCTNPQIKIGNNVYKVNVSVPSGSRLEIDSIDKTVYLYNERNVMTNCFSKRSRKADVGNDIFEKIPQGRNIIIASDDFYFDVDLIETRGEPKWIE